MLDKVKVGIIGIGMVGKPFKRWFEERGYIRGIDLFCYDTDANKECEEDVNNADIVFVCVPTPSDSNGNCDVSVVKSAVDSINNGKTIVVKSTIPPGTVEKLQAQYPLKKIIFSPEFLTESQVWLDFQKPDRQILGPTNKSFTETKEILALLPLAHFSRPWSSDYTKKTINATEAELSKYASNVFGYMKVIFGNILADVACTLNQMFQIGGIDSTVEYDKVREVISADPRIGPAWLDVEHGDYCGAGGYCFPKDMNAFISFIEGLISDLRTSDKAYQMNQLDELLESLYKGVAVLKSIRDYNRTLLKLQGFTETEVSKHNQELILKRRKPIRQIHKKSKLRN